MSMRVCVTGSTGFIGGHVVEAFLRKGYAVNATVRDPADRKCQFLRDLGEKYGRMHGSTLTLFAADLNVKGSYDAAVAGCQTVVHVAAIVKDNYENDPFAEIINPSVEGTRSIIESCKKAGTVKRIVATSSVAAIQHSIGKRSPSNSFTEEDINTDATPYYYTYGYAKTQAEKVLQQEWTGELVTIHPSLVIGPAMDKSQATSSLQLIAALGNREFPACPPLYFDWVDVRDVAQAHLVCAESPNAKGRYITSCNQPGLILRFSDAINKTHPDVLATTGSLPWVALWTASWCDKRLTRHFLYEMCTEQPGYTSAKIKAELAYDLPHQNLEETIRDTITSMKELGILKNFRVSS